MIEIKPPSEIDIDRDYAKYTIFAAGSIESGTAENWQKVLADELREEDVIIFNPRRDAWDPSWKQSIDNPQFAEQVNWELEHIEKADLVVMFLQPGTMSPVSLLELGLVAAAPRGNKDIIVYCPDGFWRKGNVDIVCKRYGLSQASSMDDLIHQVKRIIAAYQSPLI